MFISFIKFLRHQIGTFCTVLFDGNYVTTFRFPVKATIATALHLAVVGERERAGGCAAVRSRKEGELGEMPLDAVVEKLSDEVRMRTL